MFQERLGLEAAQLNAAQESASIGQHKSGIRQRLDSASLTGLSRSHASPTPSLFLLVSTFRFGLLAQPALLSSGSRTRTRLDLIPVSWHFSGAGAQDHTPWTTVFCLVAGFRSFARSGCFPLRSKKRCVDCTSLLRVFRREGGDADSGIRRGSGGGSGSERRRAVNRWPACR